MLDLSVTLQERMVRGEARQGGAGRSGVIEGGDGAVNDNAAVATGDTVAQPTHGGPCGTRQGGELVWEALLHGGGGRGNGSGIKAHQGAETA